jgi:hypothetical protein
VIPELDGCSTSAWDPVASPARNWKRNTTARRVVCSGEMVEGGVPTPSKRGFLALWHNGPKNVTLAAPLRKCPKNRATTAIKPRNSLGETWFRSDEDGAGFEMFGAITCAKKPPLACILSPVTGWLIQVSRACGALQGLVAGASGSSVPRFPTAGAVLETTACHLQLISTSFGFIAIGDDLGARAACLGANATLQLVCMSLKIAIGSYRRGTV